MNILEYIQSQSTLTIIVWAIVIFFIVIFFILPLFSKRKTVTTPKDFKDIKQNMNALENYDKDSDEKQLKYLEGKKTMILVQAKHLRQKYNEILRMNNELKQKFYKVKKQIDILRVK